MSTTTTTLLVGPNLSRRIADWYRELADANHALGFPDLAQHCLDKAAALEYGGVLDLEPAAESEAA